MANKILFKKSSVSGKIPMATDLDYGEVALNYADGKLYYKTVTNVISTVGGNSGTLKVVDRASNLIQVPIYTGTLTVAGRSGSIIVPL